MQTTRKRAPQTTGRKSAHLHVRAAEAEKQVLERAARLKQQTLTEFVLSSASREAQRVLADATGVRLPNDRWVSLWNALETEPEDNPRLAKLARRKSVFRGRS